MVTTHIRNVTLSASVTVNAGETGIGPRMSGRLAFAGRGDFAEREGGRIRARDRRAAIARKRAWLES